MESIQLMKVKGEVLLQNSFKLDCLPIYMIFMLVHYLVLTGSMLHINTCSEYMIFMLVHYLVLTGSMLHITTCSEYYN